MATAKQCYKAAVKRYGKGGTVQVWLEVGKWPSSPQRRKESRGKIQTLKAAYDFAKQNHTDCKKMNHQCPAELLKAARFVVDTEGDRTALQSLAIWLEIAEQLQRFKEDEAAASKAYYDAKQNSFMFYYKYKITTASNRMFSTQEHAADTLGELYDMIVGKKSDTGKMVVTPMGATVVKS